MDTEDIVKLNEKEKVNESLLFNVIKYGTASLPVIIPFGLIYLFTRDILISVLGTAVIDFMIIVCLVAYALNSNEVKIPWK